MKFLFYFILFYFYFYFLKEGEAGSIAVAQRNNVGPSLSRSLVLLITKGMKRIPLEISAGVEAQEGARLGGRQRRHTS